MSKSNKSNVRRAAGEAKPKRGGRRVGAGRKPASYRSPTSITPLDRQALLAEVPPKLIETAAQRHAHTSIASLVKKLEFGLSDAARISAANAILDRGFGRPSVDAGGFGELPLNYPISATATVSAEIRTEARKYALLAIEVLRRVSEFGSSETVSVAASCALLARGLGNVAPAKLSDEFARSLGKREQAVEDAREAATGVFETPPPPPKVMQ